MVPADGVVAFLHPLPVAALWGVGERTAEALSRLGIRTVEELTRTPRRVLERALGENLAIGLVALANGIDARQVVPFEAPKSVSNEETYARDLEDSARDLPGAPPPVRIGSRRGCGRTGIARGRSR